MTSTSPRRVGDLLTLRGDAYARGRAQAASDCDFATVRMATVARVEQARAQGLIDGQAEDYLGQQWSFHQHQGGDVLAELSGIADGFALSRSDLFAHLHLSLLECLKRGAGTGADGCSVWAVSSGSDGPLLVKNRDTSGSDYGVQRVFLHEGADVGAGSMLCVGSLGSPGAYSSGMNAWSLAVADTHVSPVGVNVGWHRYFLMTRLLQTCRTVDAALDFVSAAAHAGGGTMTVADSSGAVAVVDFSAAHASVTRGTVCWRTNHYPGRGAEAAADAVDASSTERFTLLQRSLPARQWGIEDAKSLMSTHLANGAGSLCQHRDAAGSVTLSTAIYACRSRDLTFSQGNPCTSDWSVHHLNPR